MRLDFHNVCHIYDRKKQAYNLLDVNVSIPANNIAILAVQDRSAQALLKIVSGVRSPTRGKIIREGRFSLPAGEDGYFHRDLTGEENIRFIAKLYGENSAQLIQKIKDFAMISSELQKKTKSYTTPLMRKIALSTNLLMQFDLYQLGGPLTHPHPPFNKNLQDRLSEISMQAQLIIASQDKEFLKKHTQSALTIGSTGKTRLCNNLDEGLKTLEQLKKGDHTNFVE